MADVLSSSATNRRTIRLREEASSYLPEVEDFGFYTYIASFIFGAVEAIVSNSLKIVGLMEKVKITKTEVKTVEILKEVELETRKGLMMKLEFARNEPLPELKPARSALVRYAAPAAVVAGLAVLGAIVLIPKKEKS